MEEKARLAETVYSEMSILLQVNNTSGLNEGEYWKQKYNQLNEDYQQTLQRMSQSPTKLNESKQSIITQGQTELRKQRNSIAKVKLDTGNQMGVPRKSKKL